jgi:hypothetical protein
LKKNSKLNLSFIAAADVAVVCRLPAQKTGAESACLRKVTTRTPGYQSQMQAAAAATVAAAAAELQAAKLTPLISIFLSLSWAIKQSLPLWHCTECMQQKNLHRP